MRRRWVIGGAVAVALAAGAAVWWWPRAEPGVTPPTVSSDDPAVTKAVGAARDNVLARPADAAAWGKLGQTLLANGLPDPARECFAEAGRLNLRDVRWPYLEGVSLLLRDPAAAAPCWRRAAEAPGADDQAVTAKLRWAEFLLAEARPADAEPVLRGLADRHAADPRVQFNLGLLAVARDDPAAGIDHFRNCLTHPAARRKASAHLAALLAGHGPPAEAAAFARQAADLPPDAEWPDPILEETFTFTVGRESLFLQAEKQMQSGNARQAAAAFQDLIRRYPDESRSYVKLGMVLAETGDYCGAEEILRAGLAVKPDMVQGLYFLAVAQFHQAERAGLTSPAGKEKLAEAEASARKATALKSDHGFAHLYLGLALKGLGQPREAVAALRAAARATPEAADPHLHLGQALWDAGETAEAVTELETAVRLAGPADPRPRAALDRVRKADGMK